MPLQEAQKQKKQEEQQKAKENSNSQQEQQQQKAGVKRGQDPDPLGKELASASDPLSEAVKLVCLLRDNAGDRMRTHEYAFQVGACPVNHMRRAKQYGSCKRDGCSGHSGHFMASCISNMQAVLDFLDAW